LYPSHRVEGLAAAPAADARFAEDLELLILDRLTAAGVTSRSTLSATPGAKAVIANRMALPLPPNEPRILEFPPANPGS
jgi:hypothetical protein